jgi:hypothetical protein
MKDQISGEAEESSSPLGTKNAIKDKTALFQRKPKSNNFSAVFDWKGRIFGKREQRWHEKSLELC